MNKIIWDGSQPVARKNGNSYEYYVYNAHGDVVALVGESGTLLDERSYDDWGMPTKDVSSGIGYAGEYYDRETRQIYLRARYYQPGVRRFTQEDPARDQLNWYSCFENNPMNYVDPTGWDSYIIYAKNGKYTVADLDVKKMKWLTFSTCNSGNPDVYSLADAFIDRMTITRRVDAFDGGCYFNHEAKRLEMGPYGGWYKEKNWP